MRTGLYVDVANFTSKANELEIKIDINNFLNHVKKQSRGRITLKKAFYNKINGQPHQKIQGFINFLKKNGFKLIGTEKKQIHDHKTETIYYKNQDDIILMCNMMLDTYNDQFDTIVLISGDSDFYHPLQACRQIKPGLKINIYAFTDNISAELRKLSDKIFFFDDHPELLTEYNKNQLKKTGT